MFPAKGGRSRKVHGSEAARLAVAGTIWIEDGLPRRREDAARNAREVGARR